MGACTETICSMWKSLEAVSLCNKELFAQSKNLSMVRFSNISLSPLLPRKRKTRKRTKWKTPFRRYYGRKKSLEKRKSHKWRWRQSWQARSCWDRKLVCRFKRISKTSLEIAGNWNYNLLREQQQEGRKCACLRKELISQLSLSRHVLPSTWGRRWMLCYCSDKLSW